MASDSENLAELVALGSSIKDAAEALGIPESAAYQISRHTEFKAEVYKIRTEKTEALSALALGAAAEALACLRLLARSSERDSDRIAACKAILAQVLPLAETAELRRRLDELEKLAAEEGEAAFESVG
jgi:hypothetical protein